MNKKICALALGLVGLAFGGGASAATLTLTPVNGNVYQHTIQNPCIFRNNSCNNPGNFSSTQVPNGDGLTSYDLLSPTTPARPSSTSLVRVTPFWWVSISIRPIPHKR